MIIATSFQVEAGVAAVCKFCFVFGYPTINYSHVEEVLKWQLPPPALGRTLYCAGSTQIQRRQAPDGKVPS